MEKTIEWGKWILENYSAILNGVDLILAGSIAIFTLIPGPEPERSLQKIADIISKISRKKKEGKNPNELQ